MVVWAQVNSMSFFLLGLLLKVMGVSVATIENATWNLIEGHLFPTVLVVLVMLWLVNWLQKMMHPETCWLFSQVLTFQFPLLNNFPLAVCDSATIRLKLLWLNHLAAAAHVSHGSYFSSPQIALGIVLLCIHVSSIVPGSPKRSTCVFFCNIIQPLKVILSFCFSKHTQIIKVKTPPPNSWPSSDRLDILDTTLKLKYGRD